MALGFRCSEKLVRNGLCSVQLRYWDDCSCNKRGYIFLSSEIEPLQWGSGRMLGEQSEDTENQKIGDLGSKIMKFEIFDFAIPFFWFLREGGGDALWGARNVPRGTG